MSDALALPSDLTPDERAVVDALRADALRRADADACLAVAVGRERQRLERRGIRGRAMLQRITEAVPVTFATARRIAYAEDRWSVLRGD